MRAELFLCFVSYCAWHIFQAIPLLCVCLAALHLLIAASLSWGTFSNVLEGCSGWKYSELTPTRGSLSQWDLGYKYFCSLTLPLRYL